MAETQSLDVKAHSILQSLVTPVFVIVGLSVGAFVLPVLADEESALTRPTPTAADGSVSGIVIAPTGEPVAGATVRVQGEGLSWLTRDSRPEAWVDPATVRTGEDGSFVVSNRSGARFTVRIEARGFAPLTMKRVSSGSPLTLQVTAGRKLSGRVFDATTRRPLESALILICDNGALVFGEEACLEARSDDEGRFAVVDAPASVLVEVLGHGYARSGLRSLELPLPPDEQDQPRQVEFDLHPGGSVSGQVVDPRDNPVEGVRLTVETLGGGPRNREHRPLRHVFSDAEGRFAFRGVRAGARIRVHARKPGWPESESESIEIDAGSELRDLEIRLEDPAILTLRLVDRDERPLDEDVEILLRNHSTQLPDVSGAGKRRVLRSQIERGEDGRYTVGSLHPGRYDVVLSPRHLGEVKRGDVTLEPGKTTDLGTIVAPDGESIGGRVTDPDGLPIDGAHVRAVYGALGSYKTRDTHTAEDGGYQVTGLGDSPVLLLRVVAEGYSRQSKQDVLPGATEVDFVLEPTGGITGLVTLESGEAATAFRIRIQREAESSDGVGELLAAVVNPELERSFRAEDGSFEFGGLAPGSHTLEVRVPRKARAVATGIEVASGELTQVETITVPDGLTLRGRVVDGEHGGPIMDAAVQARQPSGGFNALGARTALVDAAALSDIDGAFELDGLALGYHTLQVSHADFAPADVRFQLRAEGEPEELVVQLSRGGTLSGTVLDRQGHPVADARIILARSLMELADAESTTSGSDGRYRMSLLSAGSYRVGGPFGLEMKTAVIRDGEDTIVDFEEATRISLSGFARLGHQPIAETTIVFLPKGDASNPTELKSCRTDQVGRYEVGFDRAGVYRAVAQRASINTIGLDPFAAGPAVEIVVPEASQAILDIVFPQGVVSGRVVDPESHPVAGARISAQPVDATAGDAAGTTLAESNGRFRIDGLAPGAYRVSATATGFQIAMAPTVVVSPEGPAPEIEVVLRPGRGIRGRLIDHFGHGIPSAIVVSAPAGAGTPLATVPVETNGDGSFSFTAPSEGPVDVTAIAAGWAPARLTGVVPAADLDENELLLQAGFGGTLRVAVLDGDGIPHTSVQVAVQSIPRFVGDELARTLRPIMPTDAEGQTRVDLLSPGTYEVFVPNRLDVARALAAVDENAETFVVLRGARMPENIGR